MRTGLLGDDDGVNGGVVKRGGTCFGLSARALGVVAVLLLATTGLFVGLFAWKASESKCPSKPAQKPLTPEVRDWILAAMDRTVDPCENFNQFTCGNWQQANALPVNATAKVTRSFENAEKIGTDDMQKVLNDNFSNAGQLFSSCRKGAVSNDTSSRDASKSLSSLSNWLRFVDVNLNLTHPKLADVYYLFGALQGHRLAEGAFSLSIDLTQAYSQDAPAPSDWHMALQHEMVLEWSRADSNPLFSLPNYSVWAPALAQLQADLYAQGLPTIFPSTVTAQRALDEVATLVAEGAAHWAPVNKTGPILRTNFTALEGKMDSAAYIRGLGDHSLVYTFAGQTEKDDIDRTGYADHIEAVALPTGPDGDATFPLYLMNLLTNTTLECAQAGGASTNAACARLSILQTSIKLHLAFDHLFALSPAYSAGLPAELTPWLSDRDTACSLLIQTQLSNVLQNEAWVETFAPGTRDLVLDLVQRVWEELGRTIIRTPWLDQATRTRALNKWQLMTKNVAYDTTWSNVALGLLVTGEFAADLSAAGSYYVQRLLMQADLPYDVHTPQVDGMTPFTLNAFYDPTLNSINLLPGLLMFPAYDPSLPLMLNLASYGMIIGHEMTHGFDNSGRLFDAVGQEVNWWSAASATEFEARAQCFIDQYSGYSVYGHHVNGSFTLGENIADNGGMGLAWRSYKKLAEDPETNITQQLMKEFTNDQLFWVWTSQIWCSASTPDLIADQVVTDVHSPGVIRSFAPSINRIEFAQAFGCKANQPMGIAVAGKNCQVW